MIRVTSVSLVIFSHDDHYDHYKYDHNYAQKAFLLILVIPSEACP